MHTTRDIPRPNERTSAQIAARAVRLTPCQAEPELWDSTDPADQAEARVACGFCPVRESCATLAYGEIHGTWAGTVMGRTAVAPGSRRKPQQPRDPGNPVACAWPECGRIFDRHRPDKRFCSTACQRKASVVARREQRGNERLWALMDGVSR